MSGRVLARIAGLLALAAGVAAGQQFPFQLLLTSGSTAATIANGSALTLNAEVGQAVSVHVTATYLPSNTANTAAISQTPTLLGASQFSITNFPKTLPLQLSPGNQFSFDVSFKSNSANLATAQFTLPFTETTPSSGSSSTGPTTIQNAILLILQGTSPSIQLSYVLQTNLNVQPLQPGGTLNFGGTLVNTTTLATLNITNVGSGFGTIQAITPPAGSAFKLSFVPLLPYALNSAGNSGSTLSLQIAYTPTASTTDNDQVQITLASGAMLTVLLQGNGISAAFAYTLLTSTPAPVTPPGPIALPDVALGSTSSLTVRVQNIGNANGVINNAPSVAGQAFALSDEPLFPQTLKPNDSFTFTINFTPTQPGTNKGALVVGSDLFNLTGNGLGPKLAFSYISSAGTIPLNTGDSVVFTPIAITQSEQVTFVINNAGTQPALISNIGVADAKGPFSVSGVQSFPVTLASGASTQLTVNFAPTTTG
ncbi:MAG TPA: choice-of-anchor D domain-containing protein, partial [Bryobacteraceae bacterium]|nr:choice-of-anchor D domain-containing protein [Bryobacteraceae bacterium]